MISKYPLTYLGAAVLAVGAIFAFQRSIPTPSEYSWFIARNAEDFYDSSPSFQEEEKDWFIEWYVRGFLNGYCLQDYYGSENKYAPQWAGYREGRKYRIKNPDSVDEVMRSFGYMKKVGSGTWTYGFELNEFTFDGEEESFELDTLEPIIPQLLQFNHDTTHLRLEVEGYTGPQSPFGYFKRFDFPIYQKKIYVTKISANQSVDTTAVSAPR
ncbi:hypothetical protein [Pelagicoccus albus]|uniref:Uncharacterized protein n=1 Tax=Pelagicoccus albus TaxID=415222 RepID=A0A7X1E8I4_9BACT|nr:hypothetical protein [Pelagicoccus albus]MBC2604822.1 hypothetical protein [Pelagicoccus albus]